VQLGVLLVLAMAAASPGRAPLRLQLDNCPDIDQATVNRVVTVELQAALMDERGVVTTAKAACNGGEVDLTIDDPVTGKSSSRTVPLGGQPPGLHSRLLGLAISEAVLASWVELRLAPEQRWSPSISLASFEARRDAADIAERRLQTVAQTAPPALPDIAVGPSARWFSSGLRMLGLSGSTRRWLRNHPSAGVGLAFDAGHGETSVPNLARASATSASLAPFMAMRGAFDPVVITAGAGWRAGLARLSADPVRSLRWGQSAWRGWTGPFLGAELTLPVWRATHVSAGVEVGYALVPAHGRIDGTPVIGLEGSWLNALLALGTTL
jgi:hypothetical protein